MNDKESRNESLKAMRKALDESHHQSNPIDPEYAEFKAWKENRGKMISELEAWSNDCMDGPEFPLRGCPGMIKFNEIVAKYKGGK